MPVSSAGLGQNLRSAAPDMTGRKWLELASIVARSTISWSRSRSNLMLQGATVGVLGSGKVTGKLLLAPNPALVKGIFTSYGIIGNASGVLARAIGVGVAAEFSQKAIYSGDSVGVGVGTDVSKVVLANGPALTGLISSNMAAQGWSGSQMGLISGAIGTAIASLLLTGTGTGGVSGGGGPIPSSGTSISGVK